MEIPKRDIEITDMSFRYIGSDVPVFENLSLTFLIRNHSNCWSQWKWKNNPIKLLMKFYDPDQEKSELEYH
jgi:ATP-binding cassette subfamily B protein